MGDTIQLAHGGGGRLMQRLIDEVVARLGPSPELAARHDGAVLALEGGARVVLTTDSYVVQPLFFPGGDIGRLAVFGTINDLAMCGARPLALSLALVLEEGLARETLDRVLDSLATAAAQAQVRFVTGDTKVVDRGKADQIFINTAGLGLLAGGAPTIGAQSVRAGDVLLVSGDLGRHGVAVLAQREHLRFETTIESDCAPLWPAVATLLEAQIDVRFLRDLTRGGLTAVLHELAAAAGVSLSVEEAAVPVHGDVRAACALLGLDPLSVASEGRFLAVVGAAHAERALELLRARTESALARRIGEVRARGGIAVTLRTALGTTRVLDWPLGEQLPRIC